MRWLLSHILLMVRGESELDMSGWLCLDLNTVMKTPCMLKFTTASPANIASDISIELRLLRYVEWFQIWIRLPRAL